MRDTLRRQEPNTCLGTSVGPVNAAGLELKSPAALRSQGWGRRGNVSEGKAVALGHLHQGHCPKPCAALDPSMPRVGAPGQLSARVGNFEQELTVSAGPELTGTPKARPGRKRPRASRGACTTRGVSKSPGQDGASGGGAQRLWKLST